MSAQPPSATKTPVGTPRAKDEDLIAPLCAYLGVCLPELFLLPPAFVEKGVLDMGVGPAASARLLVAFARLRPETPAATTTNTTGATDSEALRRYFSEREARETEPWRRDARRAAVQLESFARGFAEEGAVEGLRREFLTGAKAGQFSEDEALCLSYLLCSGVPPARAAYDLACLLLRVPAPARTSTHNWHAAAGMAEARREAHGATIAALPWPLFFEAPGFEALNSRLLSLGVSGAGRPVAGPFAEPRPMIGGGPLPIYGPDGLQTAALDATAVERQIAAVRSELAALRRSTGGRGRGRGSRGGRGRGRGRYQGGGPAEDEAAEGPKN